MKKIKTIFLSIFFIMIMIYSKEIYAGSAYLYSSDSSVNIGDEFTISINLSDISVATLTARMSVDTTKVQYISGSSNTNFSSGRAIYSWTDSSGGQNPLNGGTVATFTFRAISAGSAYFGISGEFFDSDEEEIGMDYSGVSIDIIDNTPQEEPENNEPTNEEPSDIPENPEENEFTNNENPNNEWDNQYSSNTNLKSLQLSVVGISPNFNKNTTYYWITIPTTIDSIDVTAITENQNAEVVVEGNNNLNKVQNYIYITVIAENGTSKKVYTINVTKSDNEEEINANLSNLAIEGAVLVPEFKEDIMEYKIDIENNLDKLNILAFPKIEGASVSIEGNENLKEGENLIKIKVTSKNGENEKIYTIKANKKTFNQAENIIKRENNVNSSKTDDITKKNNPIGIISIVIFIALIILIAIFIIKNQKNNKF